ncbi:hypothetical protein [Streptomyces sp. NPDC051183]|uniref:hypothetical protein n=1 Tax=unclassified Streptomyces TaxID=2593676 RepID=UPI003423AAC5
MSGDRPTTPSRVSIGLAYNDPVEKGETARCNDEPAACDPRLDIDFTPLRGADLATGGFSQAA